MAQIQGMEQHQGAFAVTAQKELRLTGHLRLEDQGQLGGPLIRRRQKEPIQAHLLETPSNRQQKGPRLSGGLDDS